MTSGVEGEERFGLRHSSPYRLPLTQRPQSLYLSQGVDVEPIQGGKN